MNVRFLSLTAENCPAAFGQFAPKFRQAAQRPCRSSNGAGDISLSDAGRDSRGWSRRSAIPKTCKFSDLALETTALIRGPLTDIRRCNDPDTRDRLEAVPQPQSFVRAPAKLYLLV